MLLCFFNWTNFEFQQDEYQKKRTVIEISLVRVLKKVDG